MNVAKRTQAIAELQLQFRELHADKYKKSPLAQHRGRRFEALVRGVFQAWELLESNDYYTSDNDSEQIDGSVNLHGRFALMEAKWAESTQVAASELFAFIGKVEGKFVGTIGLFVSAVGLTDNFMQALRSGRRQSIMVIHGPDVEHLFDPNFPLREYLREHLKRLSLDNVFHVPAADYYSNYKGSREGELPQVDAAGPVVARIKEVSESRDATQLVAAYAEQFTVPQREDALNRLIATYPHISRFKSVRDKSWKGQNLDSFIKELVARLPEAETPPDVRYFVNSLSPNYRSTVYLQLLGVFEPRFRWLQANNRESAERELTKQWHDKMGDWTAENELALPTSRLWEWLSDGCKRQLILLFFRIVMNDDRSPRFPQRQLAVSVLTAVENAPVIALAFRELVSVQANEYVANGYAAADKLPDLNANLQAGFARLRRYVSHYEAVIAEIAQEAQAAHQPGNG